MKNHHLPCTAALALVAALILVPGCSKKSTGVVAPGGTASFVGGAVSPEAALRQFELAWETRDFDAVSRLFTGDFTFVFSPSDSTGNAWREQPWLREVELAASHGLFVGGGSEPPATSIVLTFDPTLTVLPDPRPEHQNEAYRSILTPVALSVRTESRSYEVQGHALFYFVRADSAQIPPDLVARGLTSDPSRWWIQRWDDQTVVNPGGAATFGVGAMNQITWGQLKALYR